jgi:hypothetical protein
LVKKLENLAKVGATDCGVVGIGQSMDVANSCALKAAKNRTPFFVRYVFLGTDAIQEIGFAGDVRGNIYDVSFWIPLQGSKKRGHLSIGNCPNPVDLRIAPGGLLTCDAELAQ